MLGKKILNIFKNNSKTNNENLMYPLGVKSSEERLFPFEEITISDLIIDTNLQEAIFIATGLRPQSKADMQSLIGALDLSLINTSITLTSLIGLENATNISALNISGNQINDIKVLGNLINLTWLELANNKIKDISYISSLINLKGLVLSNNSIISIDPLVSLTNLEVLRINNILTNLSTNDLLKLKVLNKLTLLELGNNGIEVISNNGNSLIPSLPNLITLGLSQNDIYDITILSNAVNLEVLCLSNNNISDIDSLIPLINLKIVDISDNINLGILGVTSLKYLENLEKLFIANDSITKIKPIKELKKLQEVDLSNNTISDFENIPFFKEYGILYLDGCNINDNDLYYLHGNSLSYLSLDNNNIEDITVLGDFIELSGLSLNNNKISDVNSLSTLNNLFTISLNNNYIQDISPLNNITSLAGGISAKNQSIFITPGSIVNEEYSLNLNGLLKDLNGSVPVNILNIQPSNSKYDDIKKIIKWTTITSKNSLMFEFANGTLAENFWSGLVILGVEIDIPDLILRTEILNKLNININSRICDAQLRLLSSLNLSNKGITNIQGLQYAINLTKLNLNDNIIGDINLLSTLQSLEELNLCRTSISNLQPLGQLIKLEKLTLCKNFINNISDIRNLVNLQVLDLGYNFINNIDSLENMVYLTTLNINNNAIEYISALSNLNSLITINMDSNRIIDFSPLFTLDNIGNLTISNQTPSYPSQIIANDGTVIVQLSLLTLNGIGIIINISDISNKGQWDNNPNGIITWKDINKPMNLNFNYVVQFTETAITSISDETTLQPYKFGDKIIANGTATITVNKTISRGIKLF